MEFWWLYPIFGVTALSSGISFLVRRFALSTRVIDKPNDPRKTQSHPVALLGGVGIFASLALVVSVLLLFSDHFTSGEMTITHFIGIGIAGLILVVIGVLDDLYNLRPRFTLPIVLVAILVAVLFGLGIEKLTNPLGGIFFIPSIVSSILTFFWILFILYSTKLQDGVDGLVTGTTVIASIVIACLALTTAFYQPDVALLALLVAGAFIGFLPSNLPPAVHYLGESGSTFAGFAIAVLAVISGSKVMTALLVLGLPTLDMILVILDRYKSGDSIIRGDRRHLHFRLRDNGWSAGAVLAFYYFASLLFGLSTLLLTSWQKVFALAILFCITSLTWYSLKKPL